MLCPTVSSTKLKNVCSFFLVLFLLLLLSYSSLCSFVSKIDNDSFLYLLSPSFSSLSPFLFYIHLFSLCLIIRHSSISVSISFAFFLHFNHSLFQLLLLKCIYSHLSLSVSNSSHTLISLTTVSQSRQSSHTQRRQSISHWVKQTVYKCKAQCVPRAKPSNCSLTK